MIASGDDPRIVAPLSPKPADALSAVSALQPGGMRSTTAATLLAAQDLATAPLGPRAIVVYTNGPDENGVSVEQLVQAVSRAGAVLSVIQTSGDNDSWSQVVDRAGGEVLRTTTVNLVQSYGDLATALGDRYIVEFEAPGELPGVAQVAVEMGDMESTTAVTIPAPWDAAQPSEREPAGGQLRLIAIVLVGLALIVLARLALMLRSRRRAPVDTEKPSVAVTWPRASTNSHVSELATIKNGDMRPRFPPNGAPSGTLTTAPVIRPQEPRSRRGSLTDAVRNEIGSACPRLRGRTRARAGPVAKRKAAICARRRPDGRGRRIALIRRSKISAEPRAAPLLSRIGSKIAARVTRSKMSTRPESASDHAIVLTGADDAVVELARNAAGPAAVHISGNSASRYFAVRAVGTEDDLVISLRPYEGVRSLNWNGGESTGFEVRATGSWRIEVLPLSAIPTFNASFNGDGDMVVHFTGDGSLAEIVGNDAGRYFHVLTRPGRNRPPRQHSPEVFRLLPDQRRTTVLRGPSHRTLDHHREVNPVPATASTTAGVPVLQIGRTGGRSPAQLPSQVQRARHTGHEKDKPLKSGIYRVFHLLADGPGVARRRGVPAPTRAGSDEAQDRTTIGRSSSTAATSLSRRDQTRRRRPGRRRSASR